MDLPFPFPGDLPNPGIDPRSPALQADALPSEPPGKPQYVALDKVESCLLINMVALYKVSNTYTPFKG